MSTPAIEVRQLRKRYRKVNALDDLYLEVPEGSIYGFLGPNGAGKSTTMKILMGLVRPTGGWAAVLGHDVRTASLVARSRVGYLPQDPVFPADQTVRGVVTYAARLYPGHPKGRALRRRVDDLLERVGMAQPVLLWFHYPLAGPYSDWWTEDEKTAFRKTVEGYSIVAVFHGHYHRSGHYRWRGLQVYNVGSPRHSDHSFAAVRWRAGRLDVASWDWDRGDWAWHHTTRHRPVDTLAR